MKLADDLQEMRAHFQALDDAGEAGHCIPASVVVSQIDELLEEHAARREKKRQRNQTPAPTE